MMGCANIMPMMYFQLNNIPMFRGAYMITNVEHHIKAGDFKTVFRGVRINKNQLPYNQEALTTDNIWGYQNHTWENGVYPPFVAIPTGETPFAKMTSRTEKLKYCDVYNKGYRDGIAVRNAGLITNVQIKKFNGKDIVTETIQMNIHVAGDIQNICEEIANLRWFVIHSISSWRPDNSVPDGVSRHCLGLAIDINASDGCPWYKVKRKKYPNAIPIMEHEPEEGTKAPWPTIKYNYTGGYDRTHCIWSYDHPVVQIFKKHGWGWGGSYGDTMHFSVDDGH